MCISIVFSDPQQVCTAHSVQKLSLESELLCELSLAESACRRHYEYVLPAFAFDPAACQPRSRVSAGRATRPTPGNKAASDIRDQRTAAAMHGFVFDEACRARLSGILHRFCGTHSYHNFTVKVRKCHKHASPWQTSRHIIACCCISILADSVKLYTDGVRLASGTALCYFVCMHWHLFDAGRLPKCCAFVWKFCKGLCTMIRDRACMRTVP